MKVKNKEQYLRRYRKRGARAAHIPTYKETGTRYIYLETGYEVYKISTADDRVKEIDHGMKPNHAARTCNVEAHLPVKILRTRHEQHDHA